MSADKKFMIYPNVKEKKEKEPVFDVHMFRNELISAANSCTKCTKKKINGRWFGEGVLFFDDGEMGLCECQERVKNRHVGFDLRDNGEARPFQGGEINPMKKERPGTMFVEGLDAQMTPDRLRLGWISACREALKVNPKFFETSIFKGISEKYMIAEEEVDLKLAKERELARQETARKATLAVAKVKEATLELATATPPLEVSFEPHAKKDVNLF